MADERVAEIRAYPGSSVSRIEIIPPVETFPEFTEVCDAVYGSVYGKRYTQKKIPHPTEKEFARTLHDGMTVLIFGPQPPHKMEEAAVKASEVMAKKFGENVEVVQL
jgi:hypothetical protein